MEMNNEQLKQSPQPLREDGVAYFQGLQQAEKTLDETRIGRGTLHSACANATQVNERTMTIHQAWYGCNIRSAIRQDQETTEMVIQLLFARMLRRMNVDHPWTIEADALDEVRDMMDYDHTWTVEDFALCMDMMAKNQLKQHYNRPSTGWIRECQQAYNDRKYQAREEIAQRAKSRAAADAAERAYNASKHIGWGDSIERGDKVRTMAEFLSGKNKLTFAEREEMAQRDRNRPKTTDDGTAGAGE
jgi:hypothetical protein